VISTNREVTREQKSEYDYWRQGKGDKNRRMKRERNIVVRKEEME
jgi:hypothetical protein